MASSDRSTSTSRGLASDEELPRLSNEESLLVSTSTASSENDPHEDAPKGGGFLAAANLFGDPRQFLEVDGSAIVKNGIETRQGPDENGDAAGDNTETQGTTITIISDNDNDGETADSSGTSNGDPGVDPVTTSATRNSSSTGNDMGLYDPCPPGFICSRNDQESCESVRQIPITLGIGDIHAGLYCP